MVGLAFVVAIGPVGEFVLLRVVQCLIEGASPLARRGEQLPKSERLEGRQHAFEAEATLRQSSLFCDSALGAISSSFLTVASSDLSGHMR